MRVSVNDNLKAPVSRGTPIGEATVYANGAQLKTFLIYASDGVDKKDFSYYSKLVFDHFLQPF